MIMQKYMKAEFWESVRNDESYRHLIDEVMELYEKNDTADLPSLTYTSRRAFTENGDREGFEKNYFKRRIRLACAFILSLIYPEKKFYIEETNNIIWAICEEYSWVVPAHTDLTLERDLGIIDLFCAGTGGLLAEVCCFLEGKIDKIVYDRAKSEVSRRVFTLFESKEFGWEHGKNNWTAVCTGNVATAMMYWAPKLAKKFIHRFKGAAESFLSGFYADGACLEGLHYWGYGFGNFLWMAENLYEFTNGDTNLLDNEKVKKIGMFGCASFLKAGSVVSFSDGRQSCRISLAMQYFLHSKFGNDIVIPPTEKMTVMHARPCWNYILRAFTYFDKNASTVSRSNNEYYFENAGQYIINKEKYSFAVKAGHNDEPHNHNDVGSFIIASKDGQRLVDIGAGKYTRQYFRDETRYGIFCCSSAGHNVPIINGEYQKAGQQYCGTLNVKNNEITAEIGKAYGFENSSYVERSFTLQESKIILKDAFSKEAKNVTERFVIRCDNVKRDGNSLFLDDITVSIPDECERLTVTKEKHMICNNENPEDKDISEDYTVIDFILKENTKDVTVEFTVL